MNKLLIAYDLHKLGQRYTPLRDLIKASFGTWWNCLESTFIVVTDMDAVQVRDLLSPMLDGNDELVVFTLEPKAWASLGLSKQCVDWLHANG